jgi:chorismate mutase
MRLFALRGANSVERNEAGPILDATAELLRELMERDDLNAEFPAVAARQLGLDRVPLLCTREIPVPGSLPRVIRTMVHYYHEVGHEPRHVYLGEARVLRRDLESAQ